MTLAAFVRVCWSCARLNHGRRFCTCGAKLNEAKP
jgi:hypothetical protein